LVPDTDGDPAAVWRGRPAGTDEAMLFDIVVAIVIVAIAAVLGLVVHPVLWVIVIAAVLWLVGRRRVGRAGV
jgi:hypothetical protein